MKDRSSSERMMIDEILVKADTLHAWPSDQVQNLPLGARRVDAQAGIVICIREVPATA